MTIIAECGQNHCGNKLLAKTLIHLAKDNGGDLCKFQLYDHNKLYGNSDIPNVELSFDQAKMLFDYGQDNGIEVFFSVFDVERVKWCEEIGVKRYKVGARTHDFALYEAIMLTGKPCIISYDPAYDKWGWDGDWRILYCISEYPARNIHFKAGMFEDTGDKLGSSDGRAEYSKEFDGFSDHTLNLTASKVAISRGAKIIERHFCIDKHTGIDAEWSMTPIELKELREFYDEAQKCL